MRYRRVDSMFWNDEKVRALSDDGKLAFLFVLTHPQLTALGAMRATLPGLAAELGWAPRRLAAALKPAIDSGMVECNAQAAFIALPNFLKYNPPQVRNHIRAWVAALTLLPECEAKARLLARCRAHLATIPDDIRKAIPDVIAHLMGDAMPHAMADVMPHSGTGTGTGTGGEASPLPPIASPSRSSNSRITGRPSRKHVNAAWGVER